jgi:hypothetical protein
MPAVSSLSVGWSLSLFPDAHEAGGCVASPHARAAPVWELAPDGAGGLVRIVADADRSAVEAARRARARVRRYAVANRLSRLATLTYEGAGCFDPVALRADVHEFFVVLRKSLGGKAFPYLWVPEWHPRGHGLHVHFGLGEYVHWSVIRAAWGRGHVDVKLLSDLPCAASSVTVARRAAGYLGKYVGKAFADDRRASGLHRYEVARGFEPRKLVLTGRRVEHVLGQASDLLGAPPERVWQSFEARGWQGPPAVWASWSA